MSGVEDELIHELAIFDRPDGLTVGDDWHVVESDADATRRLMSRVNRDESGCWLWTGYVFPTGYGAFSVAGRRGRRAHRLAYELLVGPIPEGLTLDHLCGVKRCVNPAHLEAVTQAENVRRSAIAPATINAAKTHCPKGHPYDEVNTYVNSSGRRECHICRRKRGREWMRRKRAESFPAFTCTSCGRTTDVRDLREVQGVSVCPDCIWEPEAVR